ncbi:4569_t:CDS:1, partial [Racocetra persica]
VMLHVCHRSLQQLTENVTLSWSELFNCNIAEIENKLNDLLSPSRENLENEIVDEEKQQEIYDHEEEIRFDWMFLSEMGQNVIFDNSSDLGLCNIDRNFNWTDDVRQHYPDFNLDNTTTFIQ